MKRLLQILLLIILPLLAVSQNTKTDNLLVREKTKQVGQVTIGSKSFDASAILTLTATDKGLLIPRLTTAERDAISSPTTGLMVYNTDDGEFQFFDGSWGAIGGDGVADSSFITLQTDTNKAFNNTNIQFSDSVFFQNPVQIDSPFTVNLAQSTFKGIDATSGNFVTKDEDNVGTPLHFVRNDGRVSIGHSIPQAPLDVQFLNGESLILRMNSNAINAALNINWKGKNSSSSFVDYGFITNKLIDNTSGAENSQFRFFLMNDGAVEEKLRLYSNGNVSIGNNMTFNIAGLNVSRAVDGNFFGIEIINDQANTASSTNETSSLNFSFGIFGSAPGAAIIRAGKIDDFTTFTKEKAFMAFEINDGVGAGSTLIEAMRIVETGNLGIGLTVPTEKLEVNGNIKCDTLFSDAINIFSVSDTIFSADILTLNGTPVTIVSAPGSGKAIEVVSTTTRVLFNTTAYATNTTLRIITNTAQDPQASETRILLSTGSRITRGTIGASGPGTTDTQLADNQALTIDVVTGNPTTGDSDIIYYVTYRIITL